MKKCKIDRVMVKKVLMAQGKLQRQAAADGYDISDLSDKEFTDEIYNIVRGKR